MSVAYADRRRAERRTVQSPGMIRYGNGREQGCVVVNVSDTGAKLAVINCGLLPERFDLVCGIRRARPVKLVWRNGAELGVAFEG